MKGVLKFLVGVDGETDAMIDEAMEVGAALFVMAAQLTVARIISQNPDKLRTKQWSTRPSGLVILSGTGPPSSHPGAISTVV